jgi:hypothetical protein
MYAYTLTDNIIRNNSNDIVSVDYNMTQYGSRKLCRREHKVEGWRVSSIVFAGSNNYILRGSTEFDKNGMAYSYEDPRLITQDSFSFNTVLLSKDKGHIQSKVSIYNFNKKQWMMDGCSNEIENWTFSSKEKIEKNWIFSPNGTAIYKLQPYTLFKINENINTTIGTIVIDWRFWRSKFPSNNYVSLSTNIFTIFENRQFLIFHTKKDNAEKGRTYTYGLLEIKNNQPIRYFLNCLPIDIDDDQEQDCIDWVNCPPAIMRSFFIMNAEVDNNDNLLLYGGYRDYKCAKIEIPKHTILDIIGGQYVEIANFESVSNLSDQTS